MCYTDETAAVVCTDVPAVVDTVGLPVVIQSQPVVVETRKLPLCQICRLCQVDNYLQLMIQSVYRCLYAAGILDSCIHSTF